MNRWVRAPVKGLRSRRRMETTVAAYPFAGIAPPSPGRGRGAPYGCSCVLLYAPSGDFLCGFQVRDSPRRAGLVRQDGLAVAWRFRDADRTRNNRGQRLGGEVLTYFLGDLSGKLGASIEHREHHGGQPKLVVQLTLDQIDGAHE